MLNLETLFKSKMGWVVLVMTMAFCVVFGFWNTSLITYVVLPALLLVTISMALKRGAARITGVDLAMLMLVLYEVISFLSSTYQVNSVSFFVKLVTVTAFYVVGIVVNDRVRSIGWLMILVAVYGGLLSLGTVIQYVQFHLNAVAHGFNEVYQFKNNFGSFNIAINDWNAILYLFLASAVLCLVGDWRSEYLRNTLIACVVLIFWALIITFSRGAYLAVFVFIALTTVGFLVILGSSVRKVLRIAVIAGVLFLISLIPIADSFLSTVMMVKTTSQVRSLHGRIDTMRKSLPLVIGHPLVGVGSSNFAIHYPGNSVERGEDVNEIMFRPNNTAAHLLIEKGVLGTAVYGILFLVLLIELWREAFAQRRLPQGPFAVILFSGLVGFLLKEITFSSLLIGDGVLMLFIVWVIAVRSRCGNLIFFEFQFQPIARWFVLIGVVALIAFVVYQDVTFRRGEAANQRAIRAIEEHKTGLALRELDNAISLEPRHAIYHLNRAFVLASEHDAPFNAVDLLSEDSIGLSPVGTWQQAANEFSSAMSLVPSDPLPIIHLGWLRLYEGDTISAQKYFQMACQTDPWEPLANLSLALLCVHTGREETASDYFVKCIRVVPGVLESALWKTLMRSHVGLASGVLARLLGDFRNEVEGSGNPILQARLARILLTSGHIEESERLLSRVAKEMPNLDRPWVYLADSAFAKDELLREQLLKKAEFADRTDYLPKLKLGMLCEERQQHERAILNYRNALPLIFSVSLGPTTSRIRYYYNSSTIMEQCLPNDLTLVALPDSDPRLVCNKLSRLFRKVGSIEISDRLKKLATGRPLTTTDVGWFLR